MRARSQGSELSETFKVMERRLLRAIINPAMIAAWILGLCLAWQGDHWLEGWFHAKLAAADRHAAHPCRPRPLAPRLCQGLRMCTASAFYRFMNEVPTLLLIGIVILAV